MEVEVLEGDGWRSVGREEGGGGVVNVTDHSASDYKSTY